MRDFVPRRELSLRPDESQNSAWKAFQNSTVVGIVFVLKEKMDCCEEALDEEERSPELEVLLLS